MSYIHRNRLNWNISDEQILHVCRQNACVNQLAVTSTTIGKAVERCSYS